MLNIEGAKSKILSRRRFVLSTHIQSDGDGVGSQLALCRALNKLGFDAIVINPTPVPKNLSFLCQNGEVRCVEDLEDAEKLFDGRFAVILDMGAIDRLGKVRNYLHLCDGVMVIDHHEIEEGYEADYLVDQGASATGEITAYLIEKLGVPYTFEIAEPLYAAIMTDTGGFRYQSTTSNTHILAAKLLVTGIQPQDIYREIFEKNSLLRLKVLARVISTIKTSPGGKSAWMEITQKDLKEIGATYYDADDLVNYTLLIDGVQAGLYFKEVSENKTKVSCRSTGGFAINEFVARWGGGGHHNAAGVLLEMPLKEAKKTLISSLISALEGEDASKI